MRGFTALWLGFGILLISGCREDCSESARMGDFELLQGNLTNAIRHYERALKIDANCGVVKSKLEEAKQKASASPTAPNSAIPQAQP